MANLQIVPAGFKNVEAQYVEMMVPLYSYGCERKVKNALTHIKGIYSVNVDFSEQKVTVWGICNKYDVLSTIRNKRKEARFWNPGEEDTVELEESKEITSSSSSTSVCSRRSGRPPLSIIMGRSLSFKLALKKVFMRSNSF